MRIGIDCRMAGTGEGIGRYCEALVRSLAQIDKENEYYLIMNQISDFKFQISKQIQNPKFKTVIVKSNYYSLMEQSYFIWELLKLRLDLVHFPSFNAPILYPGKFVVTIHDVIHHRFPGRKKSRFIHRLAYRLVIWAAIKRAAAIIAVSETTKQDIIAELAARPGKIKVIYEGPGRQITSLSNTSTSVVLERYRITKPYLFFVGVWRQYKNLPALASAFDIVKTKYKIDCQLVLAGKIDEFYPEIRSQVMSVSSSGDIRALGFVPDNVLDILYREARLFVLPSLVEGFGLIGVEAQSSGLPVLASDIPVLREVLGQGAAYFDPSSPENMAREIARFWQDEAALAMLASAGTENVRRYEWKKTALETRNVYNTSI